MNRLHHVATLLGVLFLLVLSSAVHATPVCRRIEQVRHRGLVGTWDVALWVWEPCAYSRHRAGKRNTALLPAVLVATGGLVLASDYDHLARALASRGYVVLVPQYDDRPSTSPLVKESVAKSRADGFDCPPNPVLTSVSLMFTVARYVRKQRLADMDRSVLFGHSFGGFVVSSYVFRSCSSNATLNIPCDGAIGTDKPAFRPVLLAMFDGLIPPNASVPAGTLLLSIVSPYYNTSPFASASNVKAGRNRAILATFANGTNHFGPNDFAPAFNHSKTNCASTRQPPENAFQTTAERQADVVRSVADAIHSSYISYRYGGDDVVPMIVKELPKTQYIASAQQFSEIA